MSLRYFKLPSPLLPHVQSFGILEEPQAAFNQRITLPDSCPAVLINLGAPLMLEMERGTRAELPRAFFIPVQTRPLQIWATGACHALGVNLATWATRLLVDEQVDLTAAPIVPLGGAWRDLTCLLATTLNRQGDLAALFQLKQFVSDWQRRAHPDVTPIRRAVELLRATDGGSRLPQIAAHCYLSPSQLERQARYFTGQTPKTLARLIRFDAACAGLLDAPARRLTDLAYAYGYADQAHFVHEFNALANCTPRAAQAYIHRLAAGAEFLQLS